MKNAAKYWRTKQLNPTPKCMTMAFFVRSLFFEITKIIDTIITPSKIKLTIKSVKSGIKRYLFPPRKIIEVCRRARTIGEEIINWQMQTRTVFNIYILKPSVEALRCSPCSPFSISFSKALMASNTSSGESTIL